MLSIGDVFSGVGPIAISAAKKVKYVYANDLNPSAVEYLARNVVLNKLDRKIEVCILLHLFQLNLSSYENLRRMINDFFLLVRINENHTTFVSLDKFVSCCYLTVFYMLCSPVKGWN